MPGTKDHVSILKTNKILVVIVKLCPACDETSMNIHETSACFHKEQEKPFKDTMKFKPKQYSTDIKSKEVKAANRLCRLGTRRHGPWLSNSWQ